MTINYLIIFPTAVFLILEIDMQTKKQLPYMELRAQNCKASLKIKYGFS